MSILPSGSMETLEGIKQHVQDSLLAMSLFVTILTLLFMQLCRALVKAYAMNPLLHSPVLFFFIPAVMGFSIYKTSAI